MAYSEFTLESVQKTFTLIWQSTKLRDATKYSASSPAWSHKRHRVAFDSISEITVFVPYLL